jgi:hypothetical protein
MSVIDAPPTTLPTSDLVNLVAPKMAPVVHMYSREQFYPSSVSWYLGRVNLFQGSTLVQPAGSVTPAMLGAHTAPGNPEQWNLVVDPTGNDPAGVHHLSQDILNIYAGQPLVNGACEAEAYYHFAEDHGTIYLTFYFFYPLNGGLGPTATWTVKPGPMGAEFGFYGHEGDWESVTVGFRRGSDDAHISVLWVAREAHGDDQWEWRDASDVAIADLQPITVYSSWHAHASWAAAGDYPRPAPNPGVDYCDDGVVWKTSDHLVNLDASPVPDWVAYTGMWGTARVINFVPNVGPPLIETGPTGPPTNSSWDGRPDGGAGVVFSPPFQIPHQGTSVPALAAFGDYLYMLYTDSSSSEIWSTRTKDGLSWTDTHQIGQQTSIPALAVFGSYLYMLYTDSKNSEIWSTRTLDGVNWTDTHTVGQNTSVPALAVLGDYLYMLYSDAHGSEIWSTRTQDGVNWIDTHQIGQNTSIPALAVFGGYLYMLYTDSHDSQIWSTRTKDGANWTDTHPVAGQHTSVPALAVFEGYMYMVYTDAKNSQLWVTRTADGLNWIDTQKIDDQGTSIPALAAFGGLLVATYSDSRSSQLWETYLDKGHAGTP